MKLNNIKDKFEDREIQPSADSWERLSQRLDTGEKKSKKPVILWLSGIAAVLILGWIAAPAFFAFQTSQPVDNVLVIEESNTIEDASNGNKDEEIEISSDLNDSDREAIVSSDIQKESQGSRVKEKRQTPVVKEVGKASVKNDIAFETVEKQKEGNLVIQDVIANKETTAVEMQMTAPISEADRLLNDALKRIGSKSQINTGVASNGKPSIDPQKLLRETEWDLEDQKRNLFENTLLDGLGRLKREAVALIDRNQ
ncbi:hypothetical protein SAMN05192588_1842 [Nonlabens sp. Hel1_33_55]|uniref:hypothetical protein n=1 Tax=Nonlabens sp. Hel1_33_55 TaxID=1336802 RepID=UPI000875D729|nr:hypothetical protein [Nonlabens sp. Hel1_33_55]SCY24381.1 hypothetical protein SAMN05192588_1842 [Nonlabens sp. Hel1_33_55]